MNGRTVLLYQPVKLATMEGLFDSEAGAGTTITAMLPRYELDDFLI